MQKSIALAQNSTMYIPAPFSLIAMCLWCRVSGVVSLVRCLWCGVSGVVSLVWCLWCGVSGVVSLVWCLWCGVSGVVSVHGGAIEFEMYTPVQTIYTLIT